MPREEGGRGIRGRSEKAQSPNHRIVGRVMCGSRKVQRKKIPGICGVAVWDISKIQYSTKSAIP
jgi:hypothetical protein